MLLGRACLRAGAPGTKVFRAHMPAFVCVAVDATGRSFASRPTLPLFLRFVA